MGKRGGPKFYQTEEFKILYEKWITGQKKRVTLHGKIKIKVIPSKLARSGFEDIENSNGTLKVKNKRTQSYRQQEEIARISSALMAYVSDPTTLLKDFERSILELHSEGVYRKKIMKLTGKSHQTVWKCVKKHTGLALGFVAQADILHESVERKKGLRDDDESAGSTGSEGSSQ